MTPAAGAPIYRLMDTKGRVHQASEGAGQVKVFIVTSSGCPIASRYRPQLDRLQREYPNVLFLAVTPGGLAPAAQEFPVLLDPHFVLARQLGASMTPEAFVFDEGGSLRYQGRIDDKFVDFGKARAQPTREDLRVAIDEVRAGRAVSLKRQRGVGCFIEYGAR